MPRRRPYRRRNPVDLDAEEEPEEAEEAVAPAVPEVAGPLPAAAERFLDWGGKRHYVVDSHI